VSSPDYAATGFTPFREFIAFLAEAYPGFHRACELTRINDYALIYRWRGSNPSLPPMILTAHYDVVPVEAGTEEAWTHPGFSGAVAEGRVWGRGTLDIKSQLTAHMEAAEALMAQGFVPQRDFYFIYGQDEETGGRNGALKAAEYLAAQGVRAEGLLDEGGFVVSGVIRGIKCPLALIGVAEKGFCNYEITVEGEGGHSSMPPAHTALGKAALLVCALEKHPLPARLTPPVLGMLRNIAGEMGFMVRMAVANLWLFRPLLLGILAKNPATNAMIRSTFAATMAKASDAANVLPQKAKITVNVRLLGGDTTDQVAAYIQETARAASPSMALSIVKQTPAEPSQVSPADSRVYRYLAGLVGELYPQAITTPYLVMGGTDARKYYNICDNVYRFTPVLITDEEKNTTHNTNESITTANYSRMIHFFKRFIQGFDA
jgi:carboxypeptidase PM20D1